MSCRQHLVVAHPILDVPGLASRQATDPSRWASNKQESPPALFGCQLDVPNPWTLSEIDSEGKMLVHGLQRRKGMDIPSVLLELQRLAKPLDLSSHPVTIETWLHGVLITHEEPKPDQGSCRVCNSLAQAVGDDISCAHQSTG
jgi:hypothetical protein